MSPIAARHSFFGVTPPAIGIEVAAERVAIVSIDAGAGVVAAYGVEPLPPGAVVPSLNARNIEDVPAADAALARAIERSGIRSSRAALVIPDAVARVSMVSFESVPASPADLDGLIRWQVRKSVPFPIAAAQLAWQRASEHDFIVTVARRDVIEEYEGLCARAGFHTGIVDLATFNLINLVLASDAGPAPREPRRSLDSEPRTQDPGPDWLLVHLTAADATLAIVREGRLIFYRNKATAADESVEDLVHQTAMYHEDRLGGGRFARVVLCGLALAAAGEVRRTIEARLGLPVETVDPRPAAALRDRIAASPELLEALAAPVGVLAREVA